ncbi:MAG: guanylate kinase [Chloroflexi bacterium]|nr:guanylate kinase [Chloroflexota bacterium]MCH2537972.1 guanylate kinase [Dehalococcoidia bacterium]MEE2926225.1 guanylate kinase [Chloroflexota bacterium]HIB11224.1 guanylate kinase [Dehalococcoidia bacterium]HIM49671.1 guanylate kinase [Dehalococcoidia bacterium]
MPQIPDASSAPPLLVVLSGPSGVGKDAALDALKLLDRPWRFVITATTRPQRPGEQDGVDYIFLETAAFLKMKERDDLLECAQVYDYWYGVPRNQVRQGLQDGKDVILKVDVQGADTVRELAPEALFIFMIPSSLDELKSRLTKRETETPSQVALRLSNAQSELGRVGEFDYRVVNREGQLEQAVAEIDAIITAEKCRTRPRVVDFL